MSVENTNNELATQDETNKDTSKSSKLFSSGDFKILLFYIGMSGIGIYYRFIRNAPITDFVISETFDWTKFILSSLAIMIRSNSWYIGVFGVVLTLFKRNLINFHTYYTTFSYVVFVTILLSYCLKI